MHFQRPLLILAPMYHVTDVVFRQIVEGCAPPDVFVTEFVNVEGLQSRGRPQLLPYLYQSESQVPLWAQIWGQNPQNYYLTARELAQRGFAGIDINMGCPDKTVVKHNNCAALIKPANRSLVVQIIAATKAGARTIPVSVKTRLGFGEIDLSWHEFLLKQNLDALTIHARTQKEKSQGVADWPAVAQIKTMAQKLAPQTLIIGNGDIQSATQALRLCQTYDWDGAMVGRSIFSDPFVFAPQSPWATFTAQQKIQLYQKHLKLFLKTYRPGDRKTDPLKKFMKVYLTGFVGAQDLRQAIAKTKDVKTMIQILDDYLANLV